MLFPLLTRLVDPALLLLRILIAAVFASSGWSHLRRPVERGESIGLPPGATRALGGAELLGAASVLLGFFTQLGALLLIGVMLGAIHRKIFVWKSGFWGEGAGGGWYYDALYLAVNLLLAATDGGAWTLT